MNKIATIKIGFIISLNLLAFAIMLTPSSLQAQGTPTYTAIPAQISADRVFTFEDNSVVSRPTFNSGSETKIALDISGETAVTAAAASSVFDSIYVATSTPQQSGYIHAEIKALNLGTNTVSLIFETDDTLGISAIVVSPTGEQAVIVKLSKGGGKPAILCVLDLKESSCRNFPTDTFSVEVDWLDAETFVYSNPSNILYVVDTKTLITTKFQVLPDIQAIQSVATIPQRKQVLLSAFAGLTADGKTLVEPDHFYIYDFESKRLQELPFKAIDYPHQLQTQLLSVSPDGAYFSYTICCQPKRTWVLGNLATGRVITQIDDGFGDIWMSDSKYVVVYITRDNDPNFQRKYLVIEAETGEIKESRPTASSVFVVVPR